MTKRPSERNPILVIDDEPEICRVVKKALGHDGVVVIEAVYVPTTAGYSLLLTPQNPDRFVDRLRSIAGGQH